MKIRIAHLVEDMGMGGIEKIIESIFLSYDETRFEHVLLCLSGGGSMYERISSKGAHAEILGIGNYHSVASMLKVSSWLKKNRIHIVHAHAHPAGYLGRMAAFIAGNVGLIYHVHTMPLDLLVRHHIKESALGFITDKILCISNSARNYLITKQFHIKDKVEVLYNGVAPPNCSEFIEKPECITGWGGCYPIIGIVASLTDNKGHASLLQAFREIFTEFPNAKLLIIGDGPELSNLIDLADRLGVRHSVVFCGIIQDVFPYLACLDIFVLPSIYREGLPCTIIEAMAMAKPVVASNLHGIPEVVQDNVNGFLFPPGDSSSMAKALIKLARNQELSRAFGEMGKKIYLDKFTFEKMMSRLEEIYEEIARKRKLVSV